jgi:hypothetical protein
VRSLDPKGVDVLLAQGRVEIESGNPGNGLEYLSGFFIGMVLTPFVLVKVF